MPSAICHRPIVSQRRDSGQPGIGDWRRKDCKRNATDAEDDTMTNEATKVLRRSRRNRVVAGVCGGLEEFFGISAFWFRLAFLIALLPGGVPGFALYVLLWLI